MALGGTAVGTGVNTHPEFAGRVCAMLSSLTGVPVVETDNHFQAQSSLDGIVEASGALKTVAVSLMKIANDIRWLGSGPRAGIGEIALPEVQPGSSIMPGKVNPVIPESAAQVAAQVLGNDAAIAVAGQSGNFEINVMMPVAAYNLLQSIDLLASASRNLAEQCVGGLEATPRGPEMVDHGAGHRDDAGAPYRLRRRGRPGQGGPGRPGRASGRSPPRGRTCRTRSWTRYWTPSR